MLAALSVAPLHALIAAAIGVATSPSVLLMVIHDQRADGPLTEQALNLTALNNAFAVLTFTMLLAQLHMQYQAGLHVVLLHPVYLLAGSLLLGWLASMLMLLLARWLGKLEDLQFVLLVGVILLTVGCAVMLKLSVLIALLALGVIARNRDRHRSLLPVEFGTAAQFFFVGLFVLTGAYLSPADLLRGGVGGAGLRGGTRLRQAAGHCTVRAAVGPAPEESRSARPCAHPDGRGGGGAGAGHHSGLPGVRRGAGGDRPLGRAVAGDREPRGGSARAAVGRRDACSMSCICSRDARGWSLRRAARSKGDNR